MIVVCNKFKMHTKVYLLLIYLFKKGEIHVDVCNLRCNFYIRQWRSWKSFLYQQKQMLFLEKHGEYVFLQSTILQMLNEKL
jgi:hypothetical protein